MRTLILLNLLSLLLTGCKPEEVPTVDSNFSYGEGEHFIGDVVKFTSSDAAIEHNWNFGDGGKSTLPNPSYVYDHPGVFAVEHTAFNVEGVASTTTDTIRVYGLVLESVRATEANYGSGSPPDRYLRISTADSTQWDFNIPLQYDSTLQLYVNSNTIQNEFLARHTNYHLRYEECDFLLCFYDFDFHVDPFDPKILEPLRYYIKDPDSDFEIELLFKKVL